MNGFAMTGCYRTQLTQRFEQALIYANHLHISQYRKDERVPYIAHLLSVAALVLEQGGDEDEAIAALLHDAVEDQGGEKLAQKFGNDLAIELPRSSMVVQNRTPCLNPPGKTVK